MHVYRGWGTEPTSVSFTPAAQEELRTGQGLVEGETVTVVRRETTPPWLIPVASVAAGALLLSLGWAAFKPARRR